MIGFVKSYWPVRFSVRIGDTSIDYALYSRNDLAEVQKAWAALTPGDLRQIQSWVASIVPPTETA